MDRQLLLLGLLREQEMHGYQINEFIDKQMAFCVDLKRSTAYYLLDKLCRGGYVTEDVGREGNRPERRIYRITPAGEERFYALLHENLATYQAPMYAEDIGVIFQHHLPSQQTADLLNERRAAVVAHQEELYVLRKSLPSNHTAVIDHHLLHTEAELRWIDELIAQAER
jgi:DNA-binding PadR family transcriptional regulator